MAVVAELEVTGNAEIEFCKGVSLLYVKSFLKSKAAACGYYRCCEEK